jgi:FlaA1/EpsC-like NDP-sugar epimerase
MTSIIDKHRPNLILHVAAYKHVPLVEANPCEGVRNNIGSSYTLAVLASRYAVDDFVLVSSDKAVRPTNVMGATKRVSEMILQGLDSVESNKTRFSIVRFGNVAESSGSVIPKFREQISQGGPVTVTDVRVTRYFMTLSVASQLVLQAASLAEGGEIFLLDMGDPLEILSIAKKMIWLSGLSVKSKLNPEGDIEIETVGLRPGEKLYEELLIEGNPRKTAHPKILVGSESFLAWPDVERAVTKLLEAAIASEKDEVLAILSSVVEGFTVTHAIHTESCSPSRHNLE